MSLFEVTPSFSFVSLGTAALTGLKPTWRGGLDKKSPWGQPQWLYECVIPVGVSLTKVGQPDNSLIKLVLRVSPGLEKKFQYELSLLVMGVYCCLKEPNNEVSKISYAKAKALTHPGIKAAIEEGLSIYYNKEVAQLLLKQEGYGAWRAVGYLFGDTYDLALFGSGYFYLPNKTSPLIVDSDGNIRCNGEFFFVKDNKITHLSYGVHLNPPDTQAIARLLREDKTVFA